MDARAVAIFGRDRSAFRRADVAELQYPIRMQAAATDEKHFIITNVMPDTNSLAGPPSLLWRVLYSLNEPKWVQ